MCFATPFVIKTVNGVEQGLPGDCIVHDPTFPEWHGSAPGEREGFRNDWMLLSGDALDALVEKYHVPLNCRISTGNEQSLSVLIHEIAIEQLHRKAFFHESIEQYVERAFLDIGRYASTQRQTASMSCIERSHRDRFLQIRTELMRTFQHPWTVKEMADIASLSPNRFAVLYRRFFGTSPIDDLIGQRLLSARQSLVSSNDTLEAIAQQCGFSNVYYFCRIFHKRMGCTPGDYRRNPVKWRL